MRIICKLPCHRPYLRIKLFNKQSLLSASLYRLCTVAKVVGKRFDLLTCDNYVNSVK